MPNSATSSAISTAIGLDKLKGPLPIETTIAVLPQIGPISCIAMRSSVFVKTVDDFVYDNSLLVSWDASPPSEILEIVRLPVRF